MPWIMLGIAGLFEIVWAIGLKYSNGLSQFWPAVGTITAMVISITLLAIAMKSLPVGTAYAVWTGIGAVGTVTVGILLLGDAVTPARLLCIGLIIMGIIGLKLSSP